MVCLYCVVLWCGCKAFGDLVETIDRWRTVGACWWPLSGSGGMAKRARRLALLEAAGGHAPSGTGTPCADCEEPRTIFNTSVTWSDVAKTRLTFHYAVCDTCRSAKLCKRLRDDPAAKLVQMGADAAARTRREAYGGAALAASACTDLINTLLAAQGGRCASSCICMVWLLCGCGWAWCGRGVCLGVWACGRVWDESRDGFV